MKSEQTEKYITSIKYNSPQIIEFMLEIYLYKKSKGFYKSQLISEKLHL